MRLPDGRWLRLPICPHDADRAVVSFIANHAAFSLLDALGAALAERVRTPLGPAEAAKVTFLFETLHLTRPRGSRG